MASHAGGWLVTIVETDERNVGTYRRLIRVGSDCVSRGGPLPLADIEYGAQYADIAGGDAGYAIVWGAFDADAIAPARVWHTRIRVLGPNLCDAPVINQ
jgi:hypothetical protein